MQKEPNILTLEQVRKLHEYYSTGSWWKDARVADLCVTVEALYGALKAARNRMAEAKDAHNNGEEDVELAHLEYGKAEIDVLIAQLERKE